MTAKPVQATMPQLIVSKISPVNGPLGTDRAPGVPGDNNLLPKGPSPVNLEPLNKLLELYPNRREASYISTGFREGFCIPFQGVRCGSLAKNQKSINQFEDIAKEKIGKEVMAGRVLGPFEDPPIPHLRVSPLGIVPKKAPGEYRLIHNLSFPKGASVNDAIPEQLSSVRYASFDSAVRMVRNNGPGALMGKCDIKAAFRILPIHPKDFNLLGFCFQEKFYIDRALPMGCSISCAMFEKFSTFLEWALVFRAGARDVIHYLDDFLFSGPAGSPHCKRLMGEFEALCEELGVPLAHEKTEGPSAILKFLGVELDSTLQCCRLPIDKLSTLRSKLACIKNDRKVSLKQLQEIVGHLNFACRVVAPGRAFLRRLCSAMSGLRKPHHRTRVTRSMREDIAVWLDFLEHCNGVSFWRQELLVS